MELATQIMQKWLDSTKHYGCLINKVRKISCKLNCLPMTGEGKDSVSPQSFHFRLSIGIGNTDKHSATPPWNTHLYLHALVWYATTAFTISLSGKQTWAVSAREVLLERGSHSYMASGPALYKLRKQVEQLTFVSFCTNYGVTSCLPALLLLPCAVRTVMGHELTEPSSLCSCLSGYQSWQWKNVCVYLQDASQTPV